MQSLTTNLSSWTEYMVVCYLQWVKDN
jgi:hypothetical protein